MARVTVEDCVEQVPNQFDLVILAAHRARAIHSGSELTIDRDNDKNPVVALREIADGTISPADLMEDAIESHQRHIEVDEPEENSMTTLMPGADDAPVAAQPPTDDLDEEKLLRALLAEQGR